MKEEHCYSILKFTSFCKLWVAWVSGKAGRDPKKKQSNNGQRMDSSTNSLRLRLGGHGTVRTSLNVLSIQLKAETRLSHREKGFRVLDNQSIQSYEIQFYSYSFLIALSPQSDCTVKTNIYYLDRDFI